MVGEFTYFKGKICSQQQKNVKEEERINNAIKKKNQNKQTIYQYIFKSTTQKLQSKIQIPSFHLL